MGNIARRIIDAVQNSLLDRLALQMTQVLGPVLFLGTMGSTVWMRTTLWLIPAMLVLVALAWLLGALANRRPRPRPRPRSPYDGLHELPANGIEAWKELPAEGLRPPRAMRKLVMTLALGRALPWTGVLSTALYLGAVAMLLGLAQTSSAFGADINPTLSDPETRVKLGDACIILIALLALRRWAVEQCDRLAPLPETGANPTWAGWTIGFLFLAFALSLAATFFHLPYWSGVAATVVILTLSAILPSSRDRVLEFLFGKREDPA
ncbi:MAG: hypothetical protein EON91_13400 [Brevundimonas sp.]|uniref:hypothetical protein n=1 Tax=Brevundimonas sp. TaxID=1871086 RepID=UPI001216FCDC|nr:hypothetical protein [Brevundimonas sp.]RZJ16414.1 MAG: hypothetical protein EON91_13400 [Brevundimonas sp.]